MKTKIIVALIAVVGIGLSCKKQVDNCRYEQLTPAFIYNYPDTVTVNEIFDVGLNYVVDNSCGNQVEFEVERNSNILTVWMTTVYEGCNCIDEFIEKSYNYPISFDLPGVYELRFYVSVNEFESYYITVEE
ncbi:hypothetical protein [Crocinitomix algicola]|uniref:hypothetical protein n=1 Tax=Crocinitomix algicola TaxID=1740263 RepID=UPI00082D7D07|nr:hypothetical protein [Crocinitomix algicola]